jgi:hypothetical protein
MNGERASLVGCPFFVFCCQKNMLQLCGIYQKKALSAELNGFF